MHVHLIGICGTAMASLAGLLKAKGLHVTGSDAAAYPPMSVQLAVQGITVHQPYGPANLQPRPDLVIVGNAISRGNPELEAVLDERIPFQSLPGVLYAEFLRDRERLVVAGTHGKTTTTSMLAWIFEVAGRTPSFLIGGVAENFGNSFALRDSQPFIIEGDEYDSAFFDKGPKFMHYFPDTLILTSVEFDHADIYADLAAVKTAFRRLVNLVPQRGRIIAKDQDPSVAACVAQAFAPVERYGFQADSHWRITDVDFAGERTIWNLSRAGKPWARLQTSLAGEYNVLNATAAAAVAASYDVPVARIAEALAGFKSVKRRLEVRAEVHGITVIDDFAHHPTAIAATLAALRTRYPGRRLWAICEPRSNTLRRKVFAKELAEALALADEAVLTAVFRPEAVPEDDRLSVEAVIAAIRNMGGAARPAADADAVVAAILPELRSGDVIALLSNGGFGNIYEKLPEAISRSTVLSGR